jgi:hypothetical protein
MAEDKAPQEKEPTVAPSVVAHYVGGSQVRELTPADLRRVDPSYTGTRHIVWNADNRFSVSASDFEHDPDDP